MESRTSKSCATEYLKQVKGPDIEEKTRTDILLFNTLKDVTNRAEILEEKKSDKIYYKLQSANLCNYSIIYQWTLIINKYS